MLARTTAKESRVTTVSTRDRARRRAPAVAGHDAVRSPTGSSSCSRAMTLEEKVAQLGSRWVGNDMRAESHDAQPDASRRRRGRRLNVAPHAGRLRGRRRPSRSRTPAGTGSGHLTRVFGSAR